MAKSFLDLIEQKHGLLPAGEHAFEILPQTARLFEKTTDKGAIKGVAFKVKVTDGASAGREGEIGFILDGAFEGLIRDSIAAIRPWADAVAADLSPERIKGDFTRLVAALRVAGVGKRTIGVFRHEERKGKKYLVLSAVRLDGGNNAGGVDANNPFA